MSIPVYKKPPTPIGVQELREFVAPHGPDVAVLVIWSHEIGYQVLTAGIDAIYADSALRLRDVLVAPLLSRPGSTIEDLRHEHPAPEPWTDEQKQALATVFDTAAKLLPEISTDRLMQALYNLSLDR